MFIIKLNDVKKSNFFIESDSKEIIDNYYQIYLIEYNITPEQFVKHFIEILFKKGRICEILNAISKFQEFLTIQNKLK